MFAVAVFHHFDFIGEIGADRLVPSVTLIALFLLASRDPFELAALQPPWVAPAEPVPGFGPQLCAIALEGVEINPAAGDWPEAPAAGRILEVAPLGVHTPSEDALARQIDQSFAVGRPETIVGA